MVGCLILDYLTSFNKVGLKTLSQPPLSTAYSEPSDVLNGSLFRCESSSILTQLPSFWRIVIKLCLGVDVAKSEDEEFSVVDAVEFSPESLDFRVY